MSRVRGVGGVYVWSSGIGSGMVMCGFVQADQIRLVLLFCKLLLRGIGESVV